MHGHKQMADALISEMSDIASAVKQKAVTVICPPALFLDYICSKTAQTDIRCGAQDCHDHEQGAYTGDISAGMLKDIGADFVILGHSERRQYHHESNQLVHDKAKAALDKGLTPIICVGERLEERQSGNAESVIAQQLEESLPKTAADSDFLLAYEPVWAIGSGETASTTDIQNMHAHIKDEINRILGVQKDRIAVLYGGSVKAKNAREILALPDVNGVLVGGASLKAADFCSIMQAAG